MAVCLYPSHLISVPTHCLECVHASVHIFMSTLLLMLAQPPMDSYMESWVHLCVTVFVSQSPCLCSHTLLKCVHASVHEFMSTGLPISGPPPMHSVMETGYSCMAVCLCPSHPIYLPTPCVECVHASVHEFMST